MKVIGEENVEWAEEQYFTLVLQVGMLCPLCEKKALGSPAWGSPVLVRAGRSPFGRPGDLSGLTCGAASSVGRSCSSQSGSRPSCKTWGRITMYLRSGLVRDWSSCTASRSVQLLSPRWRKGHLQEVCNRATLSSFLEYLLAIKGWLLGEKDQKIVFLAYSLEMSSQTLVVQGVVVVGRLSDSGVLSTSCILLS